MSTRDLGSQLSQTDRQVQSLAQNFGGLRGQIGANLLPLAALNQGFGTLENVLTTLGASGQNTVDRIRSTIAGFVDLHLGEEFEEFAEGISRVVSEISRLLTIEFPEIPNIPFLNPREREEDTSTSTQTTREEPTSLFDRYANAFREVLLPPLVSQFLSDDRPTNLIETLIETPTSPAAIIPPAAGVPFAAASQITPENIFSFPGRVADFIGGINDRFGADPNQDVDAPEPRRQDNPVNFNFDFTGANIFGNDDLQERIVQALSIALSNPAFRATQIFGRY